MIVCFCCRQRFRFQPCQAGADAVAVDFAVAVRVIARLRVASCLNRGRAYDIFDVALRLWGWVRAVGLGAARAHAR